MANQSSASELGTDTIGSLLFRYSIPSIIAMTASSLYNVVDRIFIGQGVGPLAISGLAITLPVMNLGVAFGALVGAGAATLVSIRLGEKQDYEAVRILGNTTVLNLILSLSYSIVMLIFLEPILLFFGASEETLPYAKDFMQIILYVNVVLHTYMGFNNVMRASGYPRKAMGATLLTVVVNVILAPIFIFVFGWGIRGAALATACAMFPSFIYTVVHFLNKKHTVAFAKGTFGLDKKIIIDIFSIGMSPFVINFCACIITIFINKQLVEWGGDYAVGAFGIINSVSMCVIMTVLGLAQGMQPIAGYNYGAKQYERVRSVFKKSVLVATCITTIGFLAAELFPREIAVAFTNSLDIIEPTLTGMRIVFILYPLIGFYIIVSNLFQSIGKAKLSVILSLSRQTFYLAPGLIAFPMFFGVNGVWIALAVADIACVLTALMMYKTQIGKILV